MRSNLHFWKNLKAPRSNFFLCDFHVHSPGSADTRYAGRYEDLSADEKLLLGKLANINIDLAQYEKNALQQCPVGNFYSLLLKRKSEVAQANGTTDGMDWAFVAVTDHNVAEYSAQLSAYAWERRSQDRLIIFPGIELDVEFQLQNKGLERCGIHLLCIFAPNSSASDIRIALNNSSGQTGWAFGSKLVIDSLPEFIARLRHHDSYPGICIAAHVSSSKGIQNETTKLYLRNLDAAIARTEAELQGQSGDKGELQARLKDLKIQRDGDSIHSDVLREIGHCGFDALQVRTKEDEKHYRRLHRFKDDKGRAVPITCSDAHAVRYVFANEESLSFIKLSPPSTGTVPAALLREVKEKALRYGDTRFSYSQPSTVHEWISGIEIIPDSADAEKFWPFKTEGNEKSFALPFSRNLNCIIGGRGSGKSAALEALSFVLNPEEFDEQAKKSDANRAEWYKRAYATLKGCVVRVCWQSTPGGRFSSLPKRTVFQTRFFDPKHAHRAVQTSTLEGQEVLAHAVNAPRVLILRIHQIEEAAAPNRLRRLFDELQGVELPNLNAEIEAIRGKLAQQRKSMIGVANKLHQLTREGQPLVEYVRRQKQFLDVNRPEVKEAYDAVDKSSDAEQAAKAISEWWKTIESDLKPEMRKESVRKFFADVKARVTGPDGTTREGHTLIQKLLAKDENGSIKSEAQLIAAIESVSGEMSILSREIDVILEALATAHKDARDGLSRRGLPAGGKDRETKKLAFEHAEAALSRYRTHLGEWKTLLAERKTLHEDLIEKCKRRTEIRKSRATRLTGDLRRDLDSSVLIIEVDAQPVADKKEFSDWLMKNFAPKEMRFREARVKAMLQNDVSPAALRNILLNVENVDQTILANRIEKAQDGRITAEELQALLPETFGCSRMPSELSEMAAHPDMIKALPLEIREGLWQFNADSTESPSKLDSVLQLDEVVFDDIPEVRLNDRPLDSGSKARPISELSPGQRCSAILPILLLTGENPILIDQPEDNLDNRLIRQVIVNILAAIKLRRQVILATHNPNLPVLGDAEQSIVLRAIAEKGCDLEATGDLDSSEVVRYITDIMEGGREAFQYRQSIYQSHWDAPIEDIKMQPVPA